MNGLALCAGYGGLELALERAFPQFRTVCYVEGEAYAVANIVKKMEDGRLHPAPIWDDLRTFDGSPWRGKVDIISGGFPCQPFSTAGKLLGNNDERHLWPFIAGIIGEIRPRYLFFENVPGVVKWILPEVLGDLTRLGYNASWCCVGADSVGAPHKRRRWFLWAQLSDPGGLGLKEPENATAGEGIGSGRELAVDGRAFEAGCSLDTEAIPDPGCDDGGKIPVESGDSRGKKSGGDGKNGPARDYRRGFESIWESEPSMGRLVDGATDWVDKLRILGNGVVPQQANYALTILNQIMEDFA